MKTEVPIDTEIMEIVPLFLNSRAEDVQNLNQFLKSERYEEIQKIAHTIKGISRPYGFPSLEDLSKKLEQQAKNKNPQDIELTLLEIQAYLRQFKS